MNVIVIIIVILLLIVMGVLGYFAYKNLMNSINPTTPKNCNITGCDPSGLCTKPMCLEYHIASFIDATIPTFNVGGIINADPNTFQLSNATDGSSQSVFILNNSQSTIVGFTCSFPKDDANAIFGFAANFTGTVIPNQKSIQATADDSNNATVSGISVAPGKGIFLAAPRLQDQDAEFQVTITSITIAPQTPKST
jgi:hypothetical protein